MILGIEILFLILGVYALITGELPSWFVGKGHSIEGKNARLIGGLMAAILPIMFCGGFTVGFIGGIVGFDPTLIVGVIEFFGVIGAAIGIAVWVQKARQPLLASPQNPNQNIEPK